MDSTKTLDNKIYKSTTIVVDEPLVEPAKKPARSMESLSRSSKNCKSGVRRVKDIQTVVMGIIFIIMFGYSLVQTVLSRGDFSFVAKSLADIKVITDHMNTMITTNHDKNTNNVNSGQIVELRGADQIVKNYIFFKNNITMSQENFLKTHVQLTKFEDCGEAFTKADVYIVALNKPLITSLIPNTLQGYCFNTVYFFVKKSN